MKALFRFEHFALLTLHFQQNVLKNETNFVIIINKLR
jgi:hypothetical protein